jgi:branched-chain amino acid transport system permease protein
VQQFVNYYGTGGAGDVCVVALLAIVLLARPHGISGRVTA